MRRYHGFSLVEVMVVIAMVGILAAIAAPSFDGLIRRSRIDAATEAFRTANAYARSEAIKRGVPVSISANSADWRNGWQVFVDDNTLYPNCSRDVAAATEILLRQQDSLGANVRFVRGTGLPTPSCTTPASASSDPSSTCVSYDARGQAVTSNGGNGAITYCIRDAVSPGSTFRRLALDFTGQLFLQKVSN